MQKCSTNVFHVARARLIDRRHALGSANLSLDGGREARLFLVIGRGAVVTFDYPQRHSGALFWPPPV
jgi:hypothetical protein